MSDYAQNSSHSFPVFNLQPTTNSKRIFKVQDGTPIHFQVGQPNPPTPKHVGTKHDQQLFGNIPRTLKLACVLDQVTVKTCKYTIIYHPETAQQRRKEHHPTSLARNNQKQMGLYRMPPRLRPSVCLFVRLSLCVSVSLPVCQSVSLCVCL